MNISIEIHAPRSTQLHRVIRVIKKRHKPTKLNSKLHGLHYTHAFFKTPYICKCEKTFFLACNPCNFPFLPP